MIRNMTPYVAAMVAAFAAGGMTMRTAGAQAAWVTPIEYCESAGCTPESTHFEWPQTLMRTTPDGGVVSASRYGEFSDERFGGVVVKRDIATGRERWRYARIGSPFQNDYFRDLALLGDGDVALVSYPELAVRLNGATGQVRWSVPRPTGFDSADAAAAGSGDDVVVMALGPTGPAPDYAAPVVIFKLAGNDGHELWRSTQPGAFQPTMQWSRLRPLANGDILANASWSTAVAAGSHHYVVRLRASDGAQQWRVEFDQAVPGAHVGDTALTTGGDLVVAGALGGQGWAARLRGADGVVLWSKTFATYTQLNRVLVLPGGDVALTGLGTTGVLPLTRVSGADGATQWSRTITVGGAGGGMTLAPAPDGTLLASGYCADQQTLCITGLDAAAGTDRWSFTRAIGPIDGQVFARDLAFDARGNLLVNAWAQSRTVSGQITAAQWRIVGPWANDLFANGFD